MAPFQNTRFAVIDLATSMFLPQVLVLGIPAKERGVSEGSFGDIDRLPMSTILVGCMHVIVTTRGLIQGTSFAGTVMIILPLQVLVFQCILARG